MDDLISRQAAIRWVKTECNPYGKPTLDFESGKRVIEHLENMPSAQPERQKGEWIEIIDTDEFGEPYPCGVRCSECAFCSVNLDNFCPNCGSDNRGDRDE